MNYGQFDLTQGFGANSLGNMSPMDLNFQPGAGAAAPAALSGIGGTPAAAPGTQGLGGLFGGMGMGQIGGSAGSAGLLGMGQLGLSGLGTLGSLWTGMQAMNLAKQQFNFQKNFANTNLANQTKSYDTQLTDKANARYYTEGKPQSQADAYVAANKL
jgi:hypothetical protein